MTARDFIAIARILGAEWASVSPMAKAPIWTLTLSLADYFAQVNPRFDREKFYAAVFGTTDHFAAHAAMMRELSAL